MASPRPVSPLNGSSPAGPAGAGGGSSTVEGVAFSVSVPPGVVGVDANVQVHEGAAAAAAANAALAAGEDAQIEMAEVSGEALDRARLNDNSPLFIANQTSVGIDVRIFPNEADSATLEQKYLNFKTQLKVAWQNTHDGGAPPNFDYLRVKMRAAVAIYWDGTKDVEIDLVKDGLMTQPALRSAFGELFDISTKIFPKNIRWIHQPQYSETSRGNLAEQDPFRARPRGYDSTQPKSPEDVVKTAVPKALRVLKKDQQLDYLKRIGRMVAMHGIWKKRLKEKVDEAQATVTGREREIPCVAANIATAKQQLADWKEVQGKLDSLDFLVPAWAAAFVPSETSLTGDDAAKRKLILDKATEATDKFLENFALSQKDIFKEFRHYKPPFEHTEAWRDFAVQVGGLVTEDRLQYHDHCVKNRSYTRPREGIEECLMRECLKDTAPDENTRDRLFLTGTHPERMSVALQEIRVEALRVRGAVDAEFVDSDAAARAARHTFAFRLGDGDLIGKIHHNLDHNAFSDAASHVKEIVDEILNPPAAT